VTRVAVVADELLLAYFGFVNPEKGLESVLHCMAALGRERFPARLLLIGGLHRIGRTCRRIAKSLDSRARSASKRRSRRLISRRGSSLASFAAADRAAACRDGDHQAIVILVGVESRVPVLSTAGEYLPPALHNGENVFLPASVRRRPDSRSPMRCARGTRLARLNAYAPAVARCAAVFGWDRSWLRTGHLSPYARQAQQPANGRWLRSW
jgi:hypothetical protein